MSGKRTSQKSIASSSVLRSSGAGARSRSTVSNSQNCERIRAKNGVRTMASRAMALVTARRGADRTPERAAQSPRAAGKAVCCSE